MTWFAYAMYPVAYLTSYKTPDPSMDSIHVLMGYWLQEVHYEKCLYVIIL